eukprot:6470156-Amphidinium_carterae.1
MRKEMCNQAWRCCSCSCGVRVVIWFSGGQMCFENSHTHWQVILAQAPLFSVNPTIGALARVSPSVKGSWSVVVRPKVGPHWPLSHGASAQAQDDRYWTLEFDSVTNVFGAIMPEISGEESIFCAQIGVQHSVQTTIITVRTVNDMEECCPILPHCWHLQWQGTLDRCAAADFCTECVCVRYPPLVYSSPGLPLGYRKKVCVLRVLQSVGSTCKLKA